MGKTSQISQEQFEEGEICGVEFKGGAEGMRSALQRCKRRFVS